MKLQSTVYVNTSLVVISVGECGPGDDPMPFLAPSEKEMIAFAAQSYDGKKSVWVPHKKEGFIKAEVQNTSGEKVTVKTVKGEVSFCKLIFIFTVKLLAVEGWWNYESSAPLPPAKSRQKFNAKY